MDPVRMTWAQFRRRTCLYFGRRVHLSAIQAEVLAVLLLRRGCVVSCAELIESIYPDAEIEPEFADDCIGHKLEKLRLKLPGLIRNVWGRGWTIDRPGVEIRMAA